MSTDDIIRQISKIVTDLSKGKIADLKSALETILPDDSDAVKELYRAVAELSAKHNEAAEFILNLSKGNLNLTTPKGNHLFDPFKELHANLRHLVWQTDQIALGDYNQRIDFLGDFSTSFNSLVTALNEKKSIEEALRESEFFFKESQRAASIGSYKTDFVTGLWESSEILDQIFGIDKSYCRSIEGWLKIIHPDDQGMMKDYLINEVIAKHQSFNKEYRIIRQSDSHTRWVNGLGQVAFDAEGKPISLIGTIQDITERKLANEALLASEERFRSLVENVNDIIYSLAPDGIFTYISPNWTEMLGHDVQEVVGQSFADFVHPEDIQKCFGVLEQINATGEKRSWVEYRIRHKDGTWKWHVSNISPKRNANGKIITILGIGRDVTENKWAEKALRESEARLNTLVQTIPDLIWLKDKDGVYLLCNIMFERFFGAREAEIVGKTDYDFVPRELADFFREHDRKAMALGRPSGNEEWITFADDGHRALLDTIKTPMYDPDGILIGVLGIGHDITERKQAEEALLKSEERYRNIFDNSIEGIFQTTLEGRLQIVNPAFVKMFGYQSPEEMIASVTNIGKQLYARSEDRDRFVALLRSEGLLHDFEVQFKHKDGSLFWVSINSRIFRNDEGAPLYIEGTLINITKRKQAEEVLNISEARLRRAELVSRMGNWEFHVDSQTLVASDGVIKLHGLNRAKPVLDAINGVVLPEYSQLIDSAAENLIENDQPLDLEYKIKTADTGEILDIQLVGFFDKEKRIIFGVIKDITERKKTEAALKENELRLRELNATKDKFFSIIAHDLKNPFNSIVGFSELLIEQVRERNYEAVEEYSGIIQNSSQQVMNLLVNLLEWSRSQTGRMEFAPEHVELVALINEVIELLGDTAKQKSIAIHREFPSNIPAFVDKAMISAILRNLLSNSIKFTRPGGHIVISAGSKNAGLEISVRDNGVGINKESIEKLFRIDENHTSLGTQNEKGTGLGLILCKEFIEKHGGKIWVESEKGLGSTFYFLLPQTKE